jgi:hypothetical protein
LRGEVEIANGASARWRENVERKKVSRKKEGCDVFRKLSRTE